VGKLLAIGRTRVDARGVIVVFIAVPGNVCFRSAFASLEERVRSMMLEDRLKVDFRGIEKRLLDSSGSGRHDHRFVVVWDAALALGCCPCCAATIGDRARALMGTSRARAAAPHGPGRSSRGPRYRG